VAAAVGTVPGTDEASISAIVARREVQTRAASGDLARAVDQAQYDTGEGPCLDTLYEQRTLRVGDLRREQRWPRFTERVTRLGVRSMLTLRLYVRGDELGSLNLFARRTDAFDDESEYIGLLFAAHAAVATAAAREQQELREAVATRDLIGQAKGVLMERYGIDDDRAFTVLVRFSQTANRKLRDVAREVVAGVQRRRDQPG
jgi:GAF domain-containing protein